MTIRQTAFEAAHEAEWLRFERWLVALPRRPKRRRGAALPDRPAGTFSEAGDTLAPRDVPMAYRRLCQHLAIARERDYSAHLVDRLNRLVLDGHQRLYGAARVRSIVGLEFLSTGFPRVVRAHARLVLFSAALLFVPMIALAVALKYRPELVYLFASPPEVTSMESMYSPERHHIGMRDASSSVQMFGYYIYNNIQIGFQTFATGILFGIGPVFFLLFNGLRIGAVAGHLTWSGYATTFWSFVPAHSAFELGGIAISGAAGLKLASALVAPGNATRREALVMAGRPAARLMFGAAMMLFVAALIEAFWSPLNLADPWPKHAVGIVTWLLVLGYFIFAGRGRAR